MPAPTFFWHDYETFGRDPRRDRPAQFAGVRTSLDLVEVAPPVMQYCQPPVDALPDPESCLLTGIVPQTCQALGLAEHAFAATVLDALSAPGTVGVGYNSIRFDDEVTRFLLWRNLIDPYAREWQNDCGRWDLLDVVRCAHALRPDGIEWPRQADGRTSFRLEHLTAANGIGHAAAHDALADVRATVALARRLKTAQPRLWDYCLRLRCKRDVVAEIGQGRPLLHISGMVPVERGCVAIVFPLAPHPTNRNELIVWDLAHDPAELEALDVAAMRLRLFTRTDALPEGVVRLPVKTIHLNKSPVVIASLKTLTPAMAERWGIDVATSLLHAEAAARIGPAVAGRWPAVYARPAPTEPADVDLDLYGGLMGDDDRRILQRLTALPPEALSVARPTFADGRLHELLFRYRARNFPATLSDDEQARWEAHRARRLLDGEGGTPPLEAYLARIDALAEDADDRAQDILGALVDHATDLAPSR